MLATLPMVLAMSEQFADYSSAQQMRFDGYTATFEELMRSIRNEFLSFCHYNPRLSPERLQEIDHSWRCAGCGPCKQAAAAAMSSRTFCFDPKRKSNDSNDKNTVQQLHAEQERQKDDGGSHQRITTRDGHTEAHL